MVINAFIRNWKDCKLRKESSLFDKSLVYLVLPVLESLLQILEHPTYMEKAKSNENFRDYAWFIYDNLLDLNKGEFRDNNETEGIIDSKLKTFLVDSNLLRLELNISTIDSDLEKWIDFCDFERYNDNEIDLLEFYSMILEENDMVSIIS